MFKNKRILVILIIILLLCLLFFIRIEVKDEEDKKVESKPLFDFMKQNIDVDEIEKISFIRYTEGGDNTRFYIERNDIEVLYNSVKSIKIGKETTRTCEDNTTVYLFSMKDGSVFKVEIECKWIVIGNKRYEIVKD